jgi:hypothetical protein
MSRHDLKRTFAGYLQIEVDSATSRLKIVLGGSTMPVGRRGESYRRITMKKAALALATAGALLTAAPAYAGGPQNQCMAWGVQYFGGKAVAQGVREYGVDQVVQFLAIISYIFTGQSCDPNY